MIFIGDIAIADKKGVDFGGIPEDLLKDVWVGNLEGALVDTSPPKAVYNNIQGFDSFLTQIPLSIACLANNHITDTGSIKSTKKLLDQRNIKSVGAGDNLEEAAEPLVYGDTVLLNFGWPVIQCVPASTDRPGTNPLVISRVLDAFGKAKRDYPNKKIVVVMHWNYELEFYPMPAQRELGRRLIDEGAELIIGHHSHLAQGVELYKDKYLVHGVGNWAFKQKAFMNGKLVFPKTSLSELAFEYSFETGVGALHYFEYDIEKNKVSYLQKELVQGSTNSHNTPYANLNRKDYAKFFLKNRKKRLILPVFYWEDSVLMTKLKVAFLKLRDMGITFVVKLRNLR